jgi:hypothetical protein
MDYNQTKEVQNFVETLDLNPNHECSPSVIICIVNSKFIMQMLHCLGFRLGFEIWTTTRPKEVQNFVETRFESKS